eukprot:10258469-Karenia_brevis.AAC.1
MMIHAAVQVRSERAWHELAVNSYWSLGCPARAPGQTGPGLCTAYARLMRELAVSIPGNLAG